MPPFVAHREVEPAPEVQQCFSTMVLDYIHGKSNGRDEYCTDNGTLVREQVQDKPGRPMVEQRVSPDQSVTTYSLKSDNIQFSIDNQGRILDYSDGKNLYSFDPSVQKPIFGAPEGGLPLFSLRDGVQAPDKRTFDLGQGLTAKSKGDLFVYSLPDHGPTVSVDQYNRVVEIGGAAIVQNERHRM